MKWIRNETYDENRAGQDPVLRSLVQDLRLLDRVDVPPGLRAYSAGQASSTPTWRYGHQSSALRLSAVVGVLAVAAVVGGVLWTMPFGTGSPVVNAAEVLQRAQQAQVSRSAEAQEYPFERVIRREMGFAGRSDIYVQEVRKWGTGPDRWRVETVEIADGVESVVSVVVTDGTQLWQFDGSTMETQVEPYDAATWQIYGSFGAYSGADMDGLLASVGQCGAASYVGTGAIAGRETHIIDINIDECTRDFQPSSVPGTATTFLLPARVWVDTETFVPLKTLSEGFPDSRRWATSEVVYASNPNAISDRYFSFDPERPIN